MARKRKKDQQVKNEVVVSKAVGSRPLGTTEFEFDLATPLFEQMFKDLETVAPIELTEENIAQVPPRPGLYVLHRNHEAVYVGKAGKNITDRLRKYRRLLSGRKGITLEEMSFRCITFAKTWDPFKPEEKLMEVLGTDKPPGWNGTGIGSNEEGKGRKTTLKPGGFLKRFPLNEEWTCRTIKAGNWDTLVLLQAIKSEVPFFFKFQGNVPGGHEKKRLEFDIARRDYAMTKVQVPHANMTAKQLLILIAKTLPPGWQATITPSHMLLYKENDAYPDGEIVWPKAKQS